MRLGVEVDNFVNVDLSATMSYLNQVLMMVLLKTYLMCTEVLVQTSGSNAVMYPHVSGHLLPQ